MANTFDLSVHGLPNPADMTAGQPILASVHRALTGSINYAHAEVNAGPVAAQGWVEDEIVQRSGAKATVTKPWAVPVLTSRHRLRCEVRAKGGAVNGGTVYFANKAGTELALPIAAGAYAYTSGTLQVASSGVDRVSMKIASALATVTVSDVLLEWVPLASPLATTAIGAFVPFGEASSGADRALSAQRGYQLIRNCDEIAGRYRVLFNIAGLVTGVLNSPSLGARWLVSNFDLYQHVQTHVGALDAGAPAYKVAYQVYPHSTDATQIAINASTDPTWNTEQAIGDSVVTIAAAGTGETWGTTTLRLPEGQAVPGIDWPTVKLGVQVVGWDGAADPPALAGGGTDRVTTARVSSLCIYGV